MRLARIFSDEAGESHFDDVDVSFDEREFIKGAEPFAVSSPWTASQVSLARLPQGWADPRHPTPVRQIVVILSGAAEITTSDGETRLFEDGSAVLLEDTEGTGHGTRLINACEALFLLVRLI